MVLGPGSSSARAILAEKTIPIVSAGQMALRLFETAVQRGLESMLFSVETLNDARTRPTDIFNSLGTRMGHGLTVMTGEKSTGDPALVWGGKETDFFDGLMYAPPP